MLVEETADFVARVFALDLPAAGSAGGFVETDVMSILRSELSTVVAAGEAGVAVTLWAVRTIQPAVKRVRCRNESALNKWACKAKHVGSCDRW
jgi:hypothetical protein